MKQRFLYFLGWIKLKLENYLQSANEKKFRKEIKLLDARLKQAKKKRQAECSHLAGGSVLSDSNDLLRRTAIVWHKLNTDETIGLCQVCGRTFLPADSDYKDWRERKSFSGLSTAGRTCDKSALPYLAVDAQDDPFLAKSLEVNGLAQTDISDDWWLLNASGSVDSFALRGWDRKPEHLIQESDAKEEGSDEQTTEF